MPRRSHATPSCRPLRSTVTLNSDQTARHARRGSAKPSSFASHEARLTAAIEDMSVAEALDLATASRADMALALERLRGGCADLIRMELEHHPD